MIDAWSNGSAETAVCGVCPHHCLLAPGERGLCDARWNVSGKIVPLAPHRICALNVDPMEKKPLYHVTPGAPILSVAKAGCTLSCQSCQNAEISQQGPDRLPGRELHPAVLAREMLGAECRWVAYTYTEPFAWLEYTSAACDAVLAAGGRNVLVTSGFASAGSVRNLAGKVTAVNADVKSMDDYFYRKYCNGELKPVLRALEIFRDAGVHLEITNLVIPGLNDGESELKALFKWVAENLGTQTPLHLSRFFPCHELSHLPPTPPARLVQALEMARETGLQHVYLGNLHDSESGNTFCPGCKKLLVRRASYRVLEQRVTPQGLCPDCATEIAGVWQ